MLWKVALTEELAVEYFNFGKTPLRLNIRGSHWRQMKARERTVYSTKRPKTFHIRRCCIFRA